MNERLQDLYNNRFSDEEKRKKNGTWIEICNYINRQFGNGTGLVVDVAAGYCDFINNYIADENAKRFAIDANPDVTKFVNDDVTAICGGIDGLKNHFEENSVQMFFMSNFLEHITKDQIRTLLKDEYDLLMSGGMVMILTPNIKYVGGKYWDFFDHITSITDNCLIEEMETLGYTLVRNIPRFLPYTTKSKLPQAQWIVRLYLKMMPLSGRFFGEQSLLLFKKE